MQTLGIDAVPVLRGDEVTERILVVMHGNLRIAGGAGGKVHQHQIVAARSVRGTVELAGIQ